MVELRMPFLKRFLKQNFPIIICIAVFFTSLSIYCFAGEFVTPASVSVQGYYRQDGTYVSPYNRRPPGGAQHDAPYDTARSITGLLMFGSGIGTLISVMTIYKDKITTRSHTIKTKSLRGSDEPLPSCAGCYYLKIARCSPPYIKNCPTYYNKEQRDLENSKHRPL